MKLTEQHGALLRHALGKTEGRVTSYRNYFVADMNSDDARRWQEMVGAGLADEFPYLLATNALRFSVTSAGRAALAALEERGDG